MQTVGETIKDLVGWMDHVEGQGPDWRKSRDEALAVLDRIQQGQLGSHTAPLIAECDRNLFRLPGPILLVDFETTGLDPYLNDICEFCAAVVTEHLVFLEKENCVVRPVSGHRDPAAMKIHGLTEPMLSRGLDPSSMLDRIDALAKTSQTPLALASWGVDFDEAFLKAAYDKAERDYPLGYRKFDVRSAVVFHLSQKGIAPGWGGVASCMKALGMEFKGEQHTALNDVVNALAVLRRCAGFDDRYKGKTLGRAHE